MAANLLQTTIFARFGFWAGLPDIILVSVLVFTILRHDRLALVFTAAISLLQDILSRGLFLQTILNVIIVSVLIVALEDWLENGLVG